MQGHALVLALIHDVVGRDVIELLEQLPLEFAHLEGVDAGQVLIGDGTLDAGELLHALQEIAHVVFARVDLDQLLLQPRELIDCLQGGAHGGFDGEHHVAGNFHVLPMKARLVHPSGTTRGRSVPVRGMNWLVM